MRLIIGAMSGTSADGVDVALVEIAGLGLSMRCRMRAHLHLPYSPGLRNRIFAVRSARQVALSELAQLGRDISIVYAEASNALLSETGVSARDIAAIAAHGQTLYHLPPNTIQWFDPALLAARTGCMVVSDFRRADCAAGGQGAPLVPFADYILFHDANVSRVLLNLGGIANLTWLGARLPIERLIAFDTGPANCLSDHLMRQADPTGCGFDPGGMLAGEGKAIQAVVEQVLADPWFASKPPKSTDGQGMIQLFDEALATTDAKNAPLTDLLATACTIAARGVRSAIEQWLPGDLDELIISGGGSENALLMRLLNGSAKVVVRSDALGIPSEAKEAIAFALLGAATLDGIAGNVPAATGAKKAVVLGSVTPAYSSSANAIFPG
jgi:anhydro-N-acetylmuramic acid kinase